MEQERFTFVALLCLLIILFMTFALPKIGLGHARKIKVYLCLSVIFVLVGFVLVTYSFASFVIIILALLVLYLLTFSEQNRISYHLRVGTIALFLDLKETVSHIGSLGSLVLVAFYQLNMLIPLVFTKYKMIELDPIVDTDENLSIWTLAYIGSILAAYTVLFWGQIKSLSSIRNASNFEVLKDVLKATTEKLGQGQRENFNGLYSWVVKQYGMDSTEAMNPMADFETMYKSKRDFISAESVDTSSHYNNMSGSAAIFNCVIYAYGMSKFLDTKEFDKYLNYFASWDSTKHEHLQVNRIFSLSIHPDYSNRVPPVWKPEEEEMLHEESGKVSIIQEFDHSLSIEQRMNLYLYLWINSCFRVETKLHMFLLSESANFFQRADYVHCHQPSVDTGNDKLWVAKFRNENECYVVQNNPIIIDLFDRDYYARISKGYDSTDSSTRIVRMCVYNKKVVQKSLGLEKCEIELEEQLVNSLKKLATDLDTESHWGANRLRIVWEEWCLWFIAPEGLTFSQKELWYKEPNWFSGRPYVSEKRNLLA